MTEHGPGAEAGRGSEKAGRGSEKAGVGNTGRRIADALRAAILSGELPPGTRIRQEEIAARYGASRIPVRAALSILEADGLVKLVANSGAWVSQFDLSECEEFYRIREQIEPMLLRASLPGLAPEVFDQMDVLAERMANTGSAEEFLRMDREFHGLSYRGAKTVVLDEHRMLVRALREDDADQAALVATGHIRRTRLQLARHPELFTVHHSP
jgi:DNA-binding GntR family transcriptional regulator